MVSRKFTNEEGYHTGHIEEQYNWLLCFPILIKPKANTETMFWLFKLMPIYARDIDAGFDYWLLRWSLLKSSHNVMDDLHRKSKRLLVVWNDLCYVLLVNGLEGWWEVICATKLLVALCRIKFVFPVSSCSRW